MHFIQHMHVQQNVKQVNISHEKIKCICLPLSESFIPREQTFATTNRVDTAMNNLCKTGAASLVVHILKLLGWGVFVRITVTRCDSIKGIVYVRFAIIKYCVCVYLSIIWKAAAAKQLILEKVYLPCMKSGRSHLPDMMHLDIFGFMCTKGHTEFPLPMKPMELKLSFHTRILLVWISYLFQRGNIAPYELTFTKK